MPLFRKRNESRCDNGFAMLDDAREILRASGYLMCHLCDLDLAAAPLSATGKNADPHIVVCPACFAREYANVRRPMPPDDWEWTEAWQALSDEGDRVLEQLPTKRGLAAPAYWKLIDQGRQTALQRCQQEERRRNQEPVKNTPSAQQVSQPPESGVQIDWVPLRRLLDEGHIDWDAKGEIGAKEAILHAAILYPEWESLAAAAWQGYKAIGRCFLLFNATTGKVGYRDPVEIHPAVFDRYPDDLLWFCSAYEPRTDVVMVIEGLIEVSDPNATAALWVRMPDTWPQPVSARLLWGQGDRS